MTALHDFLIGQSLKNTADPAWLSALRQRAYDRLKNRGLPGAKDEEWRLTRLSELYKQEFTFSTAAETLSLDEVPLTSSAESRLVFVNGAFDAGLSDHHLPDGISIMPFEQAAASEKLALQSFFNGSTPHEPHGFLCANTAFVQSGYVIHIAAKTIVEKPIEIIFVANNQKVAAWHCRNIVIADPLSEASIIERHLVVDNKTSYLSNCVTELHLANGARLNFYKHQHEAEDAYHIGGVYSQQSRDSHLVTNNIALGGKITRNDILAEFVGEGAHCEMNGLSVLSGKQHVDNCTEVIHAKPHCTSDEYYKSVLDDSSRSVFRGRIVVAKDAQKTDANQQNRNLLLSGKAEADTKPQLEIYADDVKCAHGATVGQLDQKSIFYLRSRGIPEEVARALLTFAFASDVVNRFNLPELRQQLSRQLTDQLLKGFLGSIETDDLLMESA
ncbi:MAG: Fe-S cluster assembly protein SufD [Proteobacteria bacterium]|jgi:Fe-S cluster assembly protein SufD|nr:Fe-S cluster assembly protein SufD [Pseudomonadota bacterium]